MDSPIKLSSRVRAVTIYRRGATVTRVVELVREGPAFPARIQLVGLPLTLDDSSVSVELEATDPAGRAAPIAGDLRVTVSAPGHDPALRPPTNDELERARLELELAVETARQHGRAKARLAGLQPVARGQAEEGKPPPPSPTAARMELLEFRRERAEQLARSIEAADERVREAKEQLETLRERERVASSERNARTHELRKAALLELGPPSEQGAGLVERVRVKLRYFVAGARWAPAYTLRLDAAMRAATLELRAMVGQSTGEDWSDVALTLSTASPQQWTELPELESRRIGRRQPPPAKTGWRPPPLGADELYADYDRSLGSPEPEPEPTPTPTPTPRAEPELTEITDIPELPDEDDEDAYRGSAVMPPSPPSAAPQPAPMMPVSLAKSKSAKRSGGIGSLVGDAIDGITSAFSAEDTAMQGFGSGGAMASAFEPEPELVAGRDLLDYGRLRLLFASSPRRGALRRIDTRTQYQQLSGEGVRVDAAIDQICEALEWARLLETERPPEGYRWPHSEAGFDYAYVAEAPVDLASTGAFTSLPIDLREAEATPRYVSVPRETQDVFRIVSLRNPLAAPLLPGPADVYVAGKFALSSAVELTPIDGRIELGLGVEQGIKIARNVSFTEDSSGMFKRHLGLSHTLTLEVHNHLRSPALVEIRERVPIAAEAQADDITVAVEDVTPAWDDYDPKDPDHPLDGGRVWKVEVPAKGERALSATWVVTIPTNHELVGGNRRES
ncbi:hypothetical protein ENSA5_56280 [Enhygromyxa salina]|uniref:DUF4139 domain-containing protein n=1 Tax=Enhygromyxa salina TaxID=215803 RepID=A0A2S9XER7_9BACT|nr:DUF4139 domain-containing protein [Enhygromyxa salina]PRP91362.1 hypothetical protein ENSA5_56280 [Enhygromyxa salina]